MTVGLDEPGRRFSEAEAEAYVASVCFKTGPPRKLGIEVERIVHDSADATRTVPVEEVRRAVAGVDLPGGGALSFEPGGQLELSSACADSLPELISATRTNLDNINRSFQDAGLAFSPLAADAVRPPVRSLFHPRYEAMEQHFERVSPAGRAMMCSTASLQICVDAGLDGTGPDSAVERWSRLHRLAPLLVALFANSPFHRGVPTGWRSTRQRIWLNTDPSRTTAVPVTNDPRDAWAKYALDASVLCIQPEGTQPPKLGSWSASPGLTMRDWLRGEGPRPATLADLDYHLTTLFPWVRPRGFLEIRVVDAQPGPFWEAATAITTALIEDPEAAEQTAHATKALTDLPEPMHTAARAALRHPIFAEAARTCAEAAIAGVVRLEADQQTQGLVADFLDRYTRRGRSPADDQLDSWHRTGHVPHGSPQDNQMEEVT